MVNELKNDYYLELLKKSYKKLKSYIYFDKTQLIIRDKIVQWESANNVDTELSNMADVLASGNENKLFDNIFNSISFLSFPKKLQNKSKNDNSVKVISNIKPDTIEVSEIQYFIDMDIKGFILGVAWILEVGYLLDEKIYEHSYGNRLRKNLIDKENNNPTYSPYLFEPYFQQYETWRDSALTLAKESLSKEQDVIIFTLDFKRFFYQVDIKPVELMDTIDSVLLNNDKQEKSLTCDKDELARILTCFVSKVISLYSEALKEEYSDIEDRNVLPIGFPPSNIIANYCLKKFDEAMIEGWNPLYYGRYVDDILIVDKVEKNSLIYKKASKEELTTDSLIKHYLLSFDAWKRSIVNKRYKDKGLLIEKSYNKDDESTTYVVNADFSEFPDSEIIVQNSKVKIFYFNYKQSDALIDCFQNQLRDNKSEFRFLPEDESVFQHDDYSELFSLISKGGPNKLRSIEDFSIDKFNLSKFLGKLLRVSGLVEDKEEMKFEKDISKIFDCQSIVENYMTWEKVFSILANNENFEAYYQFVDQVIKAITSIQYVNGNVYFLKKSLFNVLLSAIHKTLSIIWGPKVSKMIEKIKTRLYAEQEYFFENIIDIHSFRRAYCTTRMCDKYALILPIDCFLKDANKALNDSHTINFTKVSDVLNYEKFGDFLEGPLFNYYPYLISMGDLTYYNVYRNMKKSNHISSKDDYNHLLNKYVEINYNHSREEHKSETPIWCTDIHRNFVDQSFDIQKLVVKIGKCSRTKIKVAVANAILFESDFENVLKDTPNRTYARYKNIIKVINEALSNHVDLLVMPESFLPFEWLPIVARTCAKNQMAIVSGIEHVKLRNTSGENAVYNLTATILPYQEDNYKFSSIHFHSKTHFSPDEKEAINSYRCLPCENTDNTYELYCWNDFWFPVYCCYELSSIRDRSLFEAYADAIVAVEWNKDTKYYSNIVESLARDLHCFCIQVNTAKYGDSRITIPAKSEEIDLLKVKGGINPTILIDTIDIKGLREFQLKGNRLQSKSKSSYKQTPPDFNYEIVEEKVSGKLFENIKRMSDLSFVPSSTNIKEKD